MKGEVVRGRRTNTVTLVFPVIGSVERYCPTCCEQANHAILGERGGMTLTLCGLCNEVRR